MGLEPAPESGARSMRLEDLNALELVTSTPNAVIFRTTLKSAARVHLCAEPGDAPGNENGAAGAASGEPQAVAVRRPRIRSEEALQRFFDELRLRSSLEHPHISQLLGFGTHAPQYFTVSAWHSGGCLFDVLHTQGVRFGWPRVRRLCLQLSDALRYLHSVDVLHRDVKSANVLLDSAWTTATLSDFELAIRAGDIAGTAGRAIGRGPSNGRIRQMVGTLVYLAPEVLAGAPHSAAADVYALGIVLNEIATAAVPFVDRHLPLPELHTVLETRFNEVKLRSAIVRDGLRPSTVDASRAFPSEFVALVERCWQADVAARPTAEEVWRQLNSVSEEWGKPQAAQAADGAQHAGGGGGGGGARRDASLLAEIARAPVSTPAWLGYAAKGVPPTDVRAAVSSTAGRRGADRMEDRELLVHRVGGIDSLHLFAVFDGHGGEQCAQVMRTHLLGALYRRWTALESTAESSLIHAFEDVDEAFVRGCEQPSGCTAIAALIDRGELVVANCGDCRAVLCRNGAALALSSDHSAEDARERALVEARGGSVQKMRVAGAEREQWRVGGEIAVTRSIGDRRLKPALWSTPEVRSFALGEHDDFVILATDGLWDVMSDDDAVRLVQHTVRVPELAAKRLAMHALTERGSQDNITAVVVYLRGVSGRSNLLAV